MLVYFNPKHAGYIELDYKSEKRNIMSKRLVKKSSQWQI